MYIFEQNIAIRGSISNKFCRKSFYDKSTLFRNLKNNYYLRIL